MNADEMTPSVHGESVGQAVPDSAPGTATHRPTVNELYDALDQVTHYALTESGSSVTEQAKLVHRLLPHIVAAINAAITYRTHGSHRPSDYYGYVNVNVEIPEGTDLVMDAFLRQVRA